MSDRKSASRDTAKRSSASRSSAGGRDAQTPERARRDPAAFRTRLTTAWAAALFALLVILFFHEVAVGGRTFVSPDATAPAGFARMGEQSITHDHVYPLWNPYVFLGMPSFASGSYNPYIYPPDWPVAVLQKVLPLPELTWMLLYYVLAGLGVFVLAREWGARAEAALLGGVAFVFAPNLVAVGSHGHGSQLVDSAYLPWMVWLASRWLRRGRLTDLAWLGLVGGFQLLRGHVQICFYTWVAIGVYAAIEWIAGLRGGRAAAVTGRVAAIAVAAGLAFGLAGFYNLPLSDYARQSIRGAGENGGVTRAYATQWSLGPYELPSVVVPGWVGFGGQTYWGDMPFTDYPNAYVGLVTLLLAIPACFAGGVTRAFALTIAIVALLVSFGRNFPVYGLLYDHLPLFNKFRIPVMIVLLFQLATALGLAWGWTALLDPESVPAARRAALGRVPLIVAIVCVAALLIGGLGRGAFETDYVATASAHRAASGAPYSGELGHEAYQQFAGDLVRAALLGLAAAALAWAAVRRKANAGVLSAAALVLLAVELWPVSGRVMQPAIGDVAQRNLELGKDDVTEFLVQQGDAGAFRILPFAEFQSNRYAGFGIASVGGYNAAKPKRIQDLIGAPERLQSPAWHRLLNVRYYVAPQALGEVPPTLELVHQGSQYVYKNALALPRATVVGHYAVVRPDTAILDSVQAGARDAAEWTYLADDPHLTLGPTAGATARITSYRLNDLAVDVTTPGPALLRLADQWSPDWTAAVDGRATPVLRADYLLRAVAVPAGAHHVTFRYAPAAVRRGLLLSLGSLVAVLLLFGLGWWQSRLRPASVVAEAA